MNAAEKNRYVVPGLERGLRLLQLFNRQQRTLGAPEIAKALGVPRSTVFRILQTLEVLEFVERAYVIENGKTVLEGSRDQLLGDPTFGAKLLGLD